MGSLMAYSKMLQIESAGIYGKQNDYSHNDFMWFQ